MLEFAVLEHEGEQAVEVVDLVVVRVALDLEFELLGVRHPGEVLGEGRERLPHPEHLPPRGSARSIAHGFGAQLLGHDGELQVVHLPRLSVGSRLATRLPCRL